MILTTPFEFHFNNRTSLQKKLLGLIFLNRNPLKGASMHCNFLVIEEHTEWEKRQHLIACSTAIPLSQPIVSIGILLGFWLYRLESFLKMCNGEMNLLLMWVWVINLAESMMSVKTWLKQRFVLSFRLNCNYVLNNNWIIILRYY